MLLRILQFIFYLPLSILYPTRIKGRKKLPKGRCVITSNHRSNWDSVLFVLHTFEKKRVLAKKELFKNKLVGGVLKGIGAFPIDRSKNDLTAIKTALNVLKSDKKLLMFPEGTRNKDEDESTLSQVKSGAIMFAIKTKSPIVPLWIDRRPRIFRRVTYKIGEAFELTEFYDQKINQEVLAQGCKILEEKMLELRDKK